MKEQVIIIGLGETGIACAQYFHALQIPFQVVDSRENPPQLAAFKAQYPEVSIYTGGFPADILKTAKTVVVSPGISKDHPEIIKNLAPATEIIGDIEIFARVAMAPVVAITGSNGKSTVTTLVGKMAKRAGLRVGIGGNLGVPALNLLKQDPEIYVLELSSFQLETTYSLKPKVATILNLSPDHLDRHATVADYLIAKQRIFNQCEQAVVNREDPLLPKNLEKGLRIVSFGLDEPLENHYGLQVKDQIWLAKGKELLLPLSKLKLFGRHNVANALAALALGEAVSIPMEAMLLELQIFNGLAHRCEWVRAYQGVQWINDSKGTNVGATLAALQGLATDISGKWILIAGGIGKSADFSPLVPLVQKHCRAVVLMGEVAKELEQLFISVIPCVHAKDMEEAVQRSARLAQSGDGVLLSPACASFDMFRNFEARGDAFKVAVMALK